MTPDELRAEARRAGADATAENVVDTTAAAAIWLEGFTRALVLAGDHFEVATLHDGPAYAVNVDHIRSLLATALDLDVSIPPPRLVNEGGTTE